MPDKVWPYPIVQRPDGSRWKLWPPTTTSDGFLIAKGVVVDDDGEELPDGDGYPILHDFFLGSAQEPTAS